MQENSKEIRECGRRAVDRLNADFYSNYVFGSYNARAACCCMRAPGCG